MAIDYIKETYDLLNFYLGEEHKGKKQLGPQHDELRKDVQELVLKAFRHGKVAGISDVQYWVSVSNKNVCETMNRKKAEAMSDLGKSKYISKEK